MSQDKKSLPYENLYERKGIEKNIKEANDFVNKTLESQELREYFSKKFDTKLQDFWFEVFWNTGNKLRFQKGRLYTPLDMVAAMSYNVNKKTTILGSDIDSLKISKSSYDKDTYENKLKMLENLNNYYTGISQRLSKLSKELHQEVYGHLDDDLAQADANNPFRGGRKRQSKKNKRKSVKGKLVKRKLAKMKTYRRRY
jgi:hypothetical protein